jgi:hypothetical protein
MIATCWHFAYGIWLFAAKWGITPGNTARKRFGYVCAAFGTAICVMGLMSIYAVVVKYPNAPADVMPEHSQLILPVRATDLLATALVKGTASAVPYSPNEFGALAPEVRMTVSKFSTNRLQTGGLTNVET